MRRAKQIKKLCKCGAVIDYTMKCCSKCEGKRLEQKREANRLYDSRIRDKSHVDFYNSKAWRLTRDKILYKYFRIDIYLYYMDGSIVEANTVHHIEPLSDSYDKRLDESNLFPCSTATNKLLDDGLYKKDKAGTQRLLYELLERFKKEFNIT